MRMALLGSTGMLGRKMAEEFKNRGFGVLTPPRGEVDLSVPQTLEKFFSENKFEALVNCAGFTRVDACEDPAQYPAALDVNATAVGSVAKLCTQTNRTLVHFSTDYVFNGVKKGLYGEADPLDPINAYGRTKYLGEKLILEQAPSFYILRTSWLYGPWGNHFVKTILGLLRTKARIEVVTDQMGAPTYTGDLAAFTLELLGKKAENGIYHFSNAGETSWYGFAMEIQKQTGLGSCEILPTTSDQYPRPAKRPANSRFDLSKAIHAIGHPLRSWQDALRHYLEKDLPLETA